ncbi:MAG: hypothetical protein IK104_07225 [Clostridia bacterium]|nr:hypothetical protein [Clostridia bacterium]
MKSTIQKSLSEITLLFGTVMTTMRMISLRDAEPVEARIRTVPPVARCLTIDSFHPEKNRALCKPQGGAVFVSRKRAGDLHFRVWRGIIRKTGEKGGTGV